MRHAHFSPVVFVHFLRVLSANALKNLSFFVSICGLTAHALGSFLASRLCLVLRICKCPEYLFFVLWSYCACARLISRQAPLFIFCAYLQMPLNAFSFLFHLWSYCACARHISRQSSLSSFAYLQMPGNTFLFQSVVLLRMRQAHFSPVVFVHFCAYYLQMAWNAFSFLFHSGLAAMRQAHFSPVVFVHFLRVLSANALKCLLFFVSICGITANAPDSFIASRLFSFFCAYLQMP
jgi:hypothetical protein